MTKKKTEKKEIKQKGIKQIATISFDYDKNITKIEIDEKEVKAIGKYVYAVINDVQAIANTIREISSR